MGGTVRETGPGDRSLFLNKSNGFEQNQSLCINAQLRALLSSALVSGGTWTRTELYPTADVWPRPAGAVARHGRPVFAPAGHGPAGRRRAGGRSRVTAHRAGGGPAGDCPTITSTLRLAPDSDGIEGRGQAASGRRSRAGLGPGARGSLWPGAGDTGVCRGRQAAGLGRATAARLVSGPQPDNQCDCLSVTAEAVTLIVCVGPG